MSRSFFEVYLKFFCTLWATIRISKQKWYFAILPQLLSLRNLYSGMVVVLPVPFCSPYSKYWIVFKRCRVWFVESKLCASYFFIPNAPFTINLYCQFCIIYLFIYLFWHILYDLSSNGGTSIDSPKNCIIPQIRKCHVPMCCVQNR
jgi:hypothetical protein